MQEKVFTIKLSHIEWIKWREDMQISYTEVNTPLGRLLLAATERGVCFIQFTDNKEGTLVELRRTYRQAEIWPVSGKDKEKFTKWSNAIAAYLAGKSELSDLPLDMKGTDFQLEIWSYLRKIPTGKLQSYKEIAARLGKPDSSRAVARACASNVIAIAVPCHRVIRSDGNISGYRWGIERKQALIELEKKIPA